jgi:hypothetical protein
VDESDSIQFLRCRRRSRGVGVDIKAEHRRREFVLKSCKRELLPAVIANLIITGFEI